MKTVLLTSNSLRHKFIGSVLSQEAGLALLVTEEKSSKINDTSGCSSEDAEFLKMHFLARATSEAEFFGSYQHFPTGIPFLELENGQINSKEVQKKIEDVDPDLIVLFGTSIIKDPLLSTFEGKIINLHLGLSPYYRGSATNLYPYLFDEPECVGATIHLATSQVDKGQILYQLRPEIKNSDSPHDIGNRTILKAGQLLPQILKSYKSNKIKPVPQKGPGRLTRNKDITPYVLREIYRNFNGGMIPRYLANKDKRDAAKPIVEQKRSDSEHDSD